MSLGQSVRMVQELKEVPSTCLRYHLTACNDEPADRILLKLSVIAIELVSIVYKCRKFICQRRIGNLTDISSKGIMPCHMITHCPYLMQQAV